MKRKIELLAPGGDIDSIKAAIAAGADAVYCGLHKFNARNRAENIGFEDLTGILNLAHANNCKVFLTLNILIVGSEFSTLFTLLNKLVHTGIDGVIVQDLGLFYLLSRYFHGLKIHASTQLNTHNAGQIKFLSRLGAVRVNLARELSVEEITGLTSAAHRHHIDTEVFVHGSYCISFSGICYMSSVHGGNSGNRGQCSQPCRDRYLTTPVGQNFPLNLKDNSAYADLGKISKAGVAAIKIEGRMKKSEYVFTVVKCFKQQLDRFYGKKRLKADSKDLYKVFHREFSTGYLNNDIHKDMFFDNARDHSPKYLSKILPSFANEKQADDRLSAGDEKQDIRAAVKNNIKHLSLEKIPLTILISGKQGTPLNVSVQTPANGSIASFRVCSKMQLARKNNENAAACLSERVFSERFSVINDTPYFIDHLELDQLQSNLFMPFNELNAIKKKILCGLLGVQKIQNPVDVPFLKKPPPIKNKPALRVLIDSKKDLDVCNQTSAGVFFQLPNCFKKDELRNNKSSLSGLFLNNRKLIPWFPSILIGEHYKAAVDFLEHLQPELIVTNNTGIAYQAWKMKIPWIAGPALNIVNSFTLACLKEKFNCSGAFISNEISKNQIKRIIRPPDFRLYYSICHPIELMTSRQCLFATVIGCEKSRLDDQCIYTCNQSSSITNLKQLPLLIKKTSGSYCHIYHNIVFLNTDVVTDFAGVFSGFLTDLRDIKTETTIGTDKLQLITLFENFLNGDTHSEKKLRQMIYPSTNTQYRKGI